MVFAKIRNSLLSSKLSKEIHGNLGIRTNTLETLEIIIKHLENRINYYANCISDNTLDYRYIKLRKQAMFYQIQFLEKQSIFFFKLKQEVHHLSLIFFHFTKKC